MATVRLRYVTRLSIGPAVPASIFGIAESDGRCPVQPGSAEFAARYHELLRECVLRTGQGNVAFGPNTLGLPSSRNGSPPMPSRRRPVTPGGNTAELLDQPKGDVRPRPYRRSSRGSRPRNPSRFCQRPLRPTKRSCCSRRSGFLRRSIWRCGWGRIRHDIPRLHKRGWEHEPWPAAVIEKFEAEASRSPTRKSPFCCFSTPASEPATSPRCGGIGMTARGSRSGSRKRTSCSGYHVTRS